MKRTNLLRGLAVGALVAALAGCAVIPTFHPEVRSDAAAPADHVLIVGRIDLIPPLRNGEQKIRVGSVDPFDTAGKLRHRAILFLDDDAGAQRRQTSSVMNPVLGEWFVIAVPRAHRFVADAGVFMEYAPQLQGRRHATLETAQLLLPAPFALDVRPGDRAVYVGSWRVWRDEFHQVTRMQVSNDLPGAQAAVAARLGQAVPVRAALPALPL